MPRYLRVALYDMIETHPSTLMFVFYRRVLVLSGSTLNILFNLFRVVGPPVWIPIKWNLGFLALNAVMVMLLLMEIEEAEELAKDPEQVSEPNLTRSDAVTCQEQDAAPGRYFRCTMVETIRPPLRWQAGMTSRSIVLVWFLLNHTPQRVCYAP